MNEMEMNNRDYRNYRDDYRDYRDSYRDNYRDDYRDYRDSYRTRDYDRRGGKINNRSYRNYRHEDYYEQLEMAMEDMREQYRRLEDISEMAEQQDRTMLMKIAQKEKENYSYLKQLVEK